MNRQQNEPVPFTTPFQLPLNLLLTTETVLYDFSVLVERV